MTNLKFNAVTTLPSSFGAGSFYILPNGDQYIGKNTNEAVKLTDVYFVNNLPEMGQENKIYVLNNGINKSLHLWVDEQWENLLSGIESSINALEDILNDKSPIGHTHNYDDLINKPDLSIIEQSVSGLEDEITQHLVQNNVHTITQITDLQSILDGKASINDIGSKSNLQTVNKTNLVEAINETFTQVVDGKNQIATAINDKAGSSVVNGSDEFSVLANAVDELPTGTSNVTEGDSMVYINQSEFTNNITAYTSVFSLKINVDGTLRVKFSICGGTSNSRGLGVIYKNGTSVGTERNVLGTSFVSFTEDFNVNKDDVLSFYLRSSAMGQVAKIKDVAIFVNEENSFVSAI